MRKNKFKYAYINNLLFSYSIAEQKLEEIEDDLIYEREEKVGGKTNKVGRPTENIAIKLDADARRSILRHLIKAVNEVIYPENQKPIIRQVFELKYIKCLTRRRICTELYISERYYHNILRYIISSVGYKIGIDIYE